MFCHSTCLSCVLCVFFFKQKTAYELRISDWSSDVCSSDLHLAPRAHLLKTTGLDGEKDYRPVHLGTHDAVARAVQAGQVPAGALSKPIRSEERRVGKE